MPFLNLISGKNKVTITRVCDLLKKGHDPKKVMHDFIRINRVVWNEITESEYIWTEDMLEYQFRLCPEHLYCAYENGEVVATASGFQTTEENLRKHKTWLDKTAGGYFTHHIPEGDVGFGADLSVVRGASSKTSDRLMMSLLFCSVLGYGLKALYLGSRIPSYHKYQDMSVEDYVFGKRRSGKPLDPELYFYLKDGFKIVEIVPEYMDDPESLNYGVLIRWDNPFYGVTKRLAVLKPVIRGVGKAALLITP